MRFNDRLQNLLGRKTETLIIPGSDGQDRRIARKPLWRRYGLAVVVVLAAGAGAAWLLTRGGGNVYRAPLNQLPSARCTRARSRITSPCAAPWRRC